MKKGMAFLVGSSMAVSGLCLQMPTVTAYDVPASTIIAEDGTIYTYTSHNNGYCMEEYAYPVFDKDAYIGECYDKDADYVVRVSCADAEAFTAAFSEQYQLTLLDDGDYIVTDSSDADYEYANFSDSEWTYTDADVVARNLICSDAVQKVSIEKGYRRLTRGNIVEFTDVYWVYTDTVLTEDDFAWLGENAAVENLAEIEELRDDNEIIYQLKLSKGNWNENNWELLRYFMTGCMEMPSVHAVNNSVIRNGLAVMYTYETEKVYQSVNDYLGDVDGDGNVSVEDAVAVLTYYARQSAGLEAKLLQANVATVEEIAFLAADVDGDGQITVEDAVAILTYYAKQSAGLDAAW